MPGFLLGQFYHFFITPDNSVSVHHYCGQFGVSSSLLLPLHQVGKLDSGDNSVSQGTIRCQFIIIASLASSR